MDAQLRQQVDAVIDAYNLEWLHWETMPIWAVESRRRLSVFVEHKIEWVARNEVKILWRRIERMRQARSKVTLH